MKGEYNTTMGIKDFMEYHGIDEIVRYVIYRRGYTPYEQERKFSDESQYEDVYYTCAFIEEYFELPDGDILFGMRKVNMDTGKLLEIEYVKLSEIRLSIFEEDSNKWEDAYNSCLGEDDDD